MGFTGLYVFVAIGRYADVVELVDTPDLGSGAVRCKSSSLFIRIKVFKQCEQVFRDFAGGNSWLKLS